jgi:hypothetical protein
MRISSAKTSKRTSAVHFLRFELSTPMVTSLRAAAALAVGIDHPLYRHEVPAVPAAMRAALLADLG